MCGVIPSDVKNKESVFTDMFVTNIYSIFYNTVTHDIATPLLASTGVKPHSTQTPSNVQAMIPVLDSELFPSKGIYINDFKVINSPDINKLNLDAMKIKRPELTLLLKERSKE
jgi:hypothetical protein